MLGAAASAARFVLFVLFANPNILLLVKDVRLVKTGSRQRELLVRTQAWKDTLPPPLSSPPPALPPSSSLPRTRTSGAYALPAIAAATFGTYGGVARIRSLQQQQPLPRLSTTFSAPSERAAPGAVEEQRNWSSDPPSQNAASPSVAAPPPSLSPPPQPTPSPPSLPSPRPAALVGATPLALLLSATAAAALTRGLLLPAFPGAPSGGFLLPPTLLLLFELASNLGLPYLADARLGAAPALLGALVLLLGSAIAALVGCRHSLGLVLARALCAASEGSLPVAQAVAVAGVGAAAAHSCAHSSSSASSSTSGAAVSTPPVLASSRAAAALGRLGLVTAADACGALLGAAVAAALAQGGGEFAEDLALRLPCTVAVAAGCVALATAASLIGPLEGGGGGGGGGGSGGGGGGGRDASRQRRHRRVSPSSAPDGQGRSVDDPRSGAGGRSHGGRGGVRSGGDGGSGPVRWVAPLLLLPLAAAALGAAVQLHAERSLLGDTSATGAAVMGMAAGVGMAGGTTGGGAEGAVGVGGGGGGGGIGTTSLLFAPLLQLLLVQGSLLAPLARRLGVTGVATLGHALAATSLLAASSLAAINAEAPAALASLWSSVAMHGAMVGSYLVQPVLALLACAYASPSSYGGRGGGSGGGGRRRRRLRAGTGGAGGEGAGGGGTGGGGAALGLATVLGLMHAARSAAFTLLLPTFGTPGGPAAYWRAEWPLLLTAALVPLVLRLPGMGTVMDWRRL